MTAQHRAVSVGVVCVFMLTSALSELIPDLQPFAGEPGDSCRRARTGASPKSPGDNGFRIRMIDNPTHYIPLQPYVISLEGSQTQFYFRKFIGFMLTVEAKEEENYIIPRPDAGRFHRAGNPLLRFSEECENAVVESSLIPKRDVPITWTAPPAGVGCVIFRAIVQENPERWYMGEGNLVLELCEKGQTTPVENRRIGGCCACGIAKYELEFKGLWSKETHPKDFPINEWLTHFSDIIGASHTRDYRVWEADGYASEGVKDVAEKGATRKLETELKKSGKTYSIFKAPGLWYPNVNGITTTDFSVDDQHSSVSLLTMLSPSSDWILGVNSLQLCLPNCSWVTEKILDLYLWDAGTADGVTYVSRRQPSVPQERIQRITPYYPNNVLSPFYDPSGLPGKPLAQLTLRQQHFEAKSCGEVESGTSDSNEEDSEDEIGCPVSEWTELSPCSVTCGDGFRMRSRQYLDSNKADMNACNVKLLDKEPCQENCVGNVSCRTSDWGEWSECSVTCGKGFRTRNRRYLEHRARKVCSAEVTQKDPCMGMKPECDGSETIHSLCSVTSWSSWSPCTATCGKGLKVRTRLYYSSSSLSVCNVSLMEKMPCTGLKASCDMNFEETKEMCMLPNEVGPCRGYFPRWYFDADRRTCVQFVYGGCRGNTNNFELQRDCLRTCQEIFSGSIIDCMVTPWSDWTPCSQTCGSGHQERNRMIKLNPENGGKPCPQNLTERRICTDIPSCSEINIQDKSEICMLPKDAGSCRGYYARWYFDADRQMCLQFIYGGCEGNMNNFQLYGDCQRTCEAGFSASTTTKPYDVALIDADYQENSPVDCMVTPWSEWTPCSSSCGTGLKERRRMIKVQPENGGRPCPGRLIQRRRCNDNISCSPAVEINSERGVDETQVIDCMVTPWSDWTPCSQTCGNGQKERHRMIKVNPENGGKPCPEKLKQKRRCTDIPSCSEIDTEDKSDVDCMLSDWSDWAPCSKTCGDLAFMERIRMVKQHPRNNGEPCGHRVERKYCRLPPCLL